MSQLANVIIGLDTLSPTELETVSALVAARLGRARPATPESPEQTPSKRAPAALPLEASGGTEVNDSLILFKGRNRQNVGAVAASSGDPPEMQNLDSRMKSAITKLLRAVSVVSSGEPSGPGRKTAILQRYRAVADAWKEFPSDLRSRFE
jgi:hypothetical protein